MGRSMPAGFWLQRSAKVYGSRFENFTNVSGNKTGIRRRVALAKHRNDSQLRAPFESVSVVWGQFRFVSEVEKYAGRVFGY